MKDSLIFQFKGSSQRQRAEPASWSGESVSTWLTEPALRGSVLHSGLLNCAHKHEGGKLVCSWALSTRKWVDFKEIVHSGEFK